MSPFHGYMEDDFGEDRCVSDIRETRQQASTLAGLAIKDYWTPFDDYENIEVDGMYTEEDVADPVERKMGAPHRHGLEIERDRGYIRLNEEQPIVAVSVLGSGCYIPAYIVCEYPQPDLTMKEPRRHGQKGWNMQNLRRQMVHGMHTIHQSGLQPTMGGDEVTYHMDWEPRVWETSFHFTIEPTTTVIIRGGSGTSSHFSFRMIRLFFRA